LSWCTMSPSAQPNNDANADPPVLRDSRMRSQKRLRI
jgi:hypothetical protein